MKDLKKLSSTNIKYKVSFLIRKKNEADNFGLLYMRITIAGSRSELNLEEKINVEEWDYEEQVVTGKNAKRINEALVGARAKVKDAILFLQDNKIPATAELVKKLLNGDYQKQQEESRREQETENLILNIWDDTHTKKNQSEATRLSYGTERNYKSYRHHIEKFLIHKFGNTNISVEQVDLKFIEGFFSYLLQAEVKKGMTKKINHNRALKILSYFKSNVILVALNSPTRIISVDPFFHFKAKKVDRRKFQSTLNQEQLDAIIKLKFDNGSPISIAKDVFVAMSLTGLSYSDILKLQPMHLKPDNDGDMFIDIDRTKTGTESTIFCDPVVLKLIKKYRGAKDGYCFPVQLLETFNRYLKIIRAEAGLPSSIVLSSKVARKAKAYIDESRGVSGETQIRQLGHRSYNVLHDYTGGAKLNKIKEEMKPLTRKDWLRAV